MEIIFLLIKELNKFLFRISRKYILKNTYFSSHFYKIKCKDLIILNKILNRVDLFYSLKCKKESKDKKFCSLCSIKKFINI